jgi:outer membrane lipoprotein carrier protein
MTKRESLFALLVLFTSHTAFSADALDGARKKYERTQTLTARFSQTIMNKTLARETKSSGRIYVHRPDMFRWETLEPDASILSCNGIKFWFYTPPFRDGESGQVTVRPAKDVPSKLVIELLSGRIDVKGAFSSKTLGSDRFELTPKRPAGDIRRVELFLESQTKLVYKLILYAGSGNVTTIELSDVELGPKLDKSMFSFKIPAGTEVVR